MPTDRRTWLKQSSFALVGLGISPILSATEKKYFFLPANPILLNSNENAYGPSPLAQKAIMEVYKNSNRYPDDYIPSSTNFILFNIDKVKGDFTSLMQAKNIYVQFREHFGGKWCRVSMGTLEEMQQFCNVLKEIAS